MDIDPLTGRKLPSTAIQRVLYLAPRVHIYQIPPLRSTRGHSASSWTAASNPTAREIFTARMRVVETAIPLPSTTSSSVSKNNSAGEVDEGEEENVTVNVLLEEPSTGTLFAAIPYTDETAVEPAIDSSRFFAVRVVGEEGRKAVLGLGFEERAEAVDFSIALQDARRVLGMEKKDGGPGDGKARGGQKVREEEQKVEKRDYKLKEGEMIRVEIGGRRRGPSAGAAGAAEGRDASGGSGELDLSKFALKPPPGSTGGGFPSLPPPPSASDVKSERRRSRNMQFASPSPDPAKEVKDLGFDDGEFGEFQ